MADRSMIHGWAIAGGAIAAAAPPLLDIPALIGQEVVMVVKIAELFGERVSESAAKGVLTAAGCTVVGTGIFAATNIGWPGTIPLKAIVAAGVIEAAGNLVFDYYESKYGRR